MKEHLEAISDIYLWADLRRDSCRAFENGTNSILLVQDTYNINETYR